MDRFLVFGTHPRLSLAEYRALRPSLDTPPRLMANGAVVEDADWDGETLMRQLGGTVKLGDVVLMCKTDELDAERLAALSAERPRGNDVAFGFSVIGGTPGAHRALERLPLHLKRALKARGIRSRWVTSKDSPALSPAAVAKLKLTTKGYDFVLLVDGKDVHVGLTTQVQDADAWSLRDYGRPARDEKIGLLPPKLARIMVNLAQAGDEMTLLDPFCGSGTILMEAALATRAQKIIGSDIDAGQIAATKKNLAWLAEKNVLKANDALRFETHASDVKHIQRVIPHESVDRIVTEGDLGPPLTGDESQKTLDKNRAAVERLWQNALAALQPILKPSATLVVVWPSFKTTKGLARVKLDEQAAAQGFRILNPLAGWDDTGAPLIYHREGQWVARRIVVLEK